jgi:hypothetical protein
VGDPGEDIVTITQFSQPTQTNNNNILIAGTNTVNPDSGQMASEVAVKVTGAGLDFSKEVPVDPMTGAWPAPGEEPIEVPCTAPCTGASVTASSGDGQAMLSSYIQVIEQNQPKKITPAAIPSPSMDKQVELFRFKAPPLVNQLPESKLPESK